MKKNCVVCKDKASVLTRIRLNDGFLCSDCAKKCSEHLEDYDEITADEIKKHLEYRKRNKNSKMLTDFKPTLILGEYEILKIDEKHNTWVLDTGKHLKNENPDIFYLSQITDVISVRKKELLNQYKENTAISTNRVVKFFNRKNLWPLYGYWFYVVIKVNHPCFSEINMRINKFIINETNQTQYLSCVRYAQDIVDAVTELSEASKKQEQQD
ncbi:MAG: DUF4428 domain-containing protein [Acutalibacteraceae bacterium]|nr:DUF4428 domain-containing protein [Acutalibacteraceae bacterium]